MRLLYATYRYARHDACVLGRRRADSGCGGMAERDCPRRCRAHGRGLGHIGNRCSGIHSAARRLPQWPTRAAPALSRSSMLHMPRYSPRGALHVARPRLTSHDARHGSSCGALHGGAHVSPRVISCALHGGAHVSPRGAALAALTQVSSSTIVLLRVDASGTSCRTNTAKTTGAEHHAALPSATRNPRENHGMWTVRRGSVVVRQMS